MIKLLLGGAFYMASKGQKFKSYSNEERKQITKLYISGKESIQSLSKRLEISPNTIKTWARKYHLKGTTDIIKNGRPKLDKNMSELERLRLENEILKKFRAFIKEQDKRK